MIWVLFFLIPARAQTLSIVDVQYRPPAKAASCALSRHREQERLKVIRELSVLTRRPGAIGRGAPSPAEYDYALKKLFMPAEDWAEASAEVRVVARPPKELLDQIKAEGLRGVFLITRGPGFVWQSYADQLPPEMSILVGDDLLTLTYATFLNAICERDLTPVTLEWVRDADGLS